MLVSVVINKFFAESWDATVAFIVRTLFAPVWIINRKFLKLHEEVMLLVRHIQHELYVMNNCAAKLIFRSLVLCFSFNLQSQLCIQVQHQTPGQKVQFASEARCYSREQHLR